MNYRNDPHPNRLKDITGKRYNLLVIKSYSHYEKRNNERYYFWNCLCDCGSEIVVHSTNLRKGFVKSCHKCTAKKHIVHGMHLDRFYRIWVSMKSRCVLNDDYVKNGIKHSSEWKSFDNFKKDMYKKYLNHKKKYGEKNTTLDRIDVTGNYCKDNCRWATYSVQGNNRRYHKLYTYNGITKNMAQWAREYNISANVLNYRLFEGNYSFIKAVTTPINHK